jgi:hypothetical protein
VNVLNKQSRRANKGWTSSLGVGAGAKLGPALSLITVLFRFISVIENFTDNRIQCLTYSTTQA